MEVGRFGDAMCSLESQSLDDLGHPQGRLAASQPQMGDWSFLL